MEGIFIGIAALACPIGMGAMMWLMAKGMRRDRDDEPPAGDSAGVASLREEHDRLGAEIDRLEAGAPADSAGAPR